jgi:hypothetical protein
MRLLPPVRPGRWTVNLTVATGAGILSLSLVLVAWAASFVDPLNQGGAPTTPLRFTSALDGDWSFSLHNNDGQSLSWAQGVMAGHGPDCAAPPALHPISAIDDGLFACKNHLMTTVSGGYGEIMLMPDYVLDWSDGPATLQWNMSTVELSARDWVDVWLTPFEELVQLPVEDFIPDLGGHARNAIQVMLGGFAQTVCSHPDPFPPQGSCPYFGLHIYRNGSDSAAQTNSSTSWYDVLQNHGLLPDLARRDTFQLTISPLPGGRIHVRFGMPAYDFFPIDNDQAPVPYTRAVVQFGHHGYNATKACPNGVNAYPTCGNGTWHWSDVSLSPAARFTLIHPTSPVYATGPTSVTFQQPAPANAVLLFQATGNARIDGRSAPVQATTTGQGACDHAKSFFMPIPAGTSSVTVSDGGGACVGFYARDFQIISPDPPSAAVPPVLASSTPTSTAVPTMTPAPRPANTPTPVASPPTSAPATTILLGNAVIQATTDSSAPGQSESFPFTAVGSGTATVAHLYVDQGNTAATIVLGVYADGAGRPGALLAQTNLSDPVPGAWNAAALPATTITSGAGYWIALLQPAGSSGSIQWRDGLGSPSSISSRQTALTSLPAAASNGQTWRSSPLSAYLTTN